MSTDLNPNPIAAASTCCGHCSPPAGKTENTCAGRCSMTRSGSIATPADREAAIAELAEEYAQRRMVDEVLQEMHAVQRNVHQIEADGNALTCSSFAEPWPNDSPVRVQILACADKAEVLALLGQMTVWLESDWDCLAQDEG